MRRFALQLGWELRRLWRRPRTWVGFGACAVFEVTMAVLYRLPSVQEQLMRQVWRLPFPLEPQDAFSGLASAIELTGEASIFVGAIFLALVGGDVLGKEAEDGTLRMIFCRPVSRTSVLVQKMIVCAVYSTALMIFIAATALLLGLGLHGTGRLVIVIVRESIFGAMDFPTGLTRYVLALPLFVAGMLTVPLLACALSCFSMKPGTATTLTLAVLLTDWTIRVHPAFSAVNPYCLSTRIATYRQLFNDEIPWLRIERNLFDLAWIDATLVVVAWWAFRRRPLTAR